MAKETTTTKCGCCGKSKTKDKMILNPNTKTKTYFCDEDCLNQYLMEREYWDKIFDLFKRETGDNPNTKQIVQFQRYKKPIKDGGYNYTYVGMYLTLEYLIEIEGKMLSTEDDIVGLIPYYYDATKKLYGQQNEISCLTEDIDLERHITTIKVKPKPSTFKAGRTLEFDTWEEEEGEEENDG